MRKPGDLYRIQLTLTRTLSLSHSVDLAKAVASVYKTLFSQLPVSAQILLTQKHQLVTACPACLPDLGHAHPLPPAMYSTVPYTPPPWYLVTVCLLPPLDQWSPNFWLSSLFKKKKKSEKSSEHATPIIFILKYCTGTTELRCYIYYKICTKSDKSLAPVIGLQEIQTTKKHVNLYNGESINKKSDCREFHRTICFFKKWTLREK